MYAMKFFVWSDGEIESILGEEAVLFSHVFDVTAGGNWEGVNILYRGRSDEQLPKPSAPSDVALVVHVETHGRDTERFELRSKLLLPRQEVRARDVELITRMLTGRSDQQPLGAARPESLHEPENAH